jgi:intraflagellar transport protein 74
MNNEMKEFEDVQGMRNAFESTKHTLVDLRVQYQKRRDSMRQQVQQASVEHEAAKRALTNHDTARELDDTEKRLKHYERSIFEIRDFVASRSRETDYEAVKASCMKIMGGLNDDAIKLASQNPSLSAQAKW